MDAHTLIFLIAAALSNLAGAGFFLLRSRWEDQALRLLLGTGAGFMLAVALVDMFPRAQEHTPWAAAWVLAGFLIVHMFEHVFTTHFHYGQETHAGLRAQVGIAATLGLGVHSVVDGIAIVVAMQTDLRLGWLVFLAMVWHKIPSGFTAASIVSATGGTRRAALRAGLILGVACVVGGLLYSVLPSRGWIGPALGISAGSLIYVAATDLLPEVNRRRTPLAPLGVVAGVAAFYLAHWMLGH
ncbi:MAG: ZIP family metal transporter [Candidatus Zixiibacteriota bacterium]